MNEEFSFINLLWAIATLFSIIIELRFPEKTVIEHNKSNMKFQGRFDSFLQQKED